MYTAQNYLYFTMNTLSQPLLIRIVLKRDIYWFPGLASIRKSLNVQFAFLSVTADLLSLCDVTLNFL